MEKESQLRDSRKRLLDMLPSDHLERSRSSWAAFSGAAPGSKRPATAIAECPPNTRSRANPYPLLGREKKHVRLPSEHSHGTEGRGTVTTVQLPGVRRNKWQHDKFEATHGDRSEANDDDKDQTPREWSMKFVPGGIETAMHAS
mmetsp:Transcript_4877/g.17695  ORF Transcript_4877/g.17695 Transcript_4877/m.17695 type:complete len:144 (+) Transcript_4877:1079-1510(+)